MEWICRTLTLVTLVALSLGESSQPSDVRDNAVEKNATFQHLAFATENDTTQLKQLINDSEEAVKQFFENGTQILLGRKDIQGRGKKEEKLMQSLYMGMMMAKSFFSIVFMFINQLFQLKNFGFQLLNAIINVGRFILQYQQHVDQQQKKVVKLQAHDWGGYGTTGYSYDNNFAYYQPYQAPSFTGHQTALGSVAERLAKFPSGATSNGHNTNFNLHTDNLAYSAYVPVVATAASVAAS